MGIQNSMTKPAKYREEGPVSARSGRLHDPSSGRSTPQFTCERRVNGAMASNDVVLSSMRRSVSRYIDGLNAGNISCKQVILPWLQSIAKLRVSVSDIFSCRREVVSVSHS